MILKEPYQRQLIILSIAAMFAGLLFSRAILSCGMGLLFITVLLSGDLKKNLQLILVNRYYLLITLLFFIPLISGLWSSDNREWWNRSAVKIPLLILPLVFTALPSFTKTMYRLLSWVYIVLISAACIWSFAKYAGDSIPVQDSYSKAAVMLVPFDDDHVRFSWAVVIALILLGKLISGFIVGRTEKYFAILVAVWLIVYLHILAAKTGLITFYVCFFIYCIFKLFSQKNKWLPLTGLLLPVVLAIAAYLLLPTFHNRVHYILWDFQQYSQGVFLPGTSDGARVVSWIGGWKIFSHNFLSGVGFGDVWNNMQQFYDTQFSYLLPHDRLFPNQFLMYASGAGIIGLFIFSLAVLIPFFIRSIRKDLYQVSFYAGTLICFLTEMNLEGQYGVFLYVFFVCWFNDKQLLKSKN